MPMLETERLILRPPQLQDLDRWAEFASDPEATRYLGGPMTRSMAWRALMSMAGSWALNGYAMFSVIEKASGRWMGRVGPWMPDGWPGTEVGWSLHRDAWGRGYATEAARAAMDFAFETLGWDDIIHCIDPLNVASQKVAQALGATRRGPGKMPPPLDVFPCELWGQTRAQWRARR